METRARQSGNTEALVAVKARDLSHPYAYLEIAEIYRRAHKRDSWREAQALGYARSLSGTLTGGGIV